MYPDGNRMDKGKHSSTMTERQFQSAVLQLARWARWMVFHAYNSRRSNPGFPDLVLVRGERCIFAELKTDTGRVSAAQEEWITALDAVPGIDAVIWRPRHWASLQAKLTT